MRKRREHFNWLLRCVQLRFRRQERASLRLLKFAIPTRVTPKLRRVHVHISTSARRLPLNSTRRKKGQSRIHCRGRITRPITPPRWILEGAVYELASSKLEEGLSCSRIRATNKKGKSANLTRGFDFALARRMISLC